LKSRAHGTPFHPLHGAKASAKIGKYRWYGVSI
jgi:hypothetical protein